MTLDNGIDSLDILHYSTTTKQYLVMRQKNKNKTVAFRSSIFVNGKLRCIFPNYPITNEEFKVKVDIKQCQFEEYIKGTMLSYFYNGSEWIWSTTSMPLINETKEYHNTLLIKQLPDLSSIMTLDLSLSLYFILSTNELFYIHATMFTTINNIHRIVTEQYRNLFKPIYNIISLPTRYEVANGLRIDDIVNYNKKVSRPKWFNGTVIKCNGYTTILK